MAGRKQFDTDTALDQAMRVFWQRGYADASLDALGSATGLGRGSLYGAFGNKDALFRQCLDRYASLYGARYEQALAAHPDDPVRAIEDFFEVVLDRIADPSVPTGCLIAQSAAQALTLKEENSARVRALLDAQHQRVRAALAGSSADARTLDELASFVVAVNQSLAVLSRAGTPDAELRSIARIACAKVADTLDRPASENTGRRRSTPEAD
ncbi:MULTISPECIES: TetR/AcrR family transcriptional regulator [Streptomyces]|uniref:TetR family transcriptional regulator n=1 Tax=Streptomyces cacaoi TaxID=1898 RepID=A0A4Y3R6T4_STRCI|nr:MULTISPECIES: TetR/AcrR family transcriptional regulator [Streptomyces]NNG86854.1 TetR/AcrR family transcriptional regulator [Streptomyces cacaoi]GEB52453.1 TetR family transcriptional regulator [Streptomyces cacaoi]